MQLLSHMHQPHQCLETVQKRINAERMDAIAQMPYKLFRTYALRSTVRISVTYIIIIPSQVFLIIIWHLISMHSLSWEGRLREMRVRTREGRLAFLKPKEKLLAF